MASATVELPKNRRDVDPQARQQPRVTVCVHALRELLGGASDRNRPALDELEDLLLRYLHDSPFLGAGAPDLDSRRIHCLCAAPWKRAY